MESLHCASCNRAFPSVLTLERHRLRCRLRPRSRKKACSECCRSKVRCDQGVPSCSRCIVHALPCSYPNPGPPTTEQVQTQPSSAPPALRGVSLPLTPSSAPSLSNWTPELHVVDPAVLHSSQAWVPNGNGDWQFEVLGVSDENINTDKPSPLVAQNLGAVSECFPSSYPSCNPFRDLSVYLGEKWTSTPQALDFLDRTLKRYIDGFASSSYQPPFIHSQHWNASGRPVALVEAAAVGQLYAARATHSDALLLKSISTQLIQTQSRLTKQEQPDDLTTIQTALLYACMRIYRAGPTSSESIDRTAFRLMQYSLSKSVDCLSKPISNPGPEDWEAWIVHESIRRSFFTLHALDYVTNARQSLPAALCAFLPSCPLPCPSHIWEAPTAEDWAARFRAWEAYCGSGGATPPLRARDLLAWLQGKTMGLEEQVLVWFQSVGEEFGELLFECLRAQARVEGIEVLL